MDLRFLDDHTGVQNIVPHLKNKSIYCHWNTELQRKQTKIRALYITENMRGYFFDDLLSLELIIRGKFWKHLLDLKLRYFTLRYFTFFRIFHITVFHIFTIFLIITIFHNTIVHISHYDISENEYLWYRYELNPYYLIYNLDWVFIKWLRLAQDLHHWTQITSKSKIVSILPFLLI